MTILNGCCGQTIDEVVDSIMSIELRSWKEGMRADSHQIKERILKFEKGIWRLKYDDVYVAYLYCIRLDEGYVLEKKTWTKITDGGSANSHTDTGNVIFGVSIGSIQPTAGGNILNAWVHAFDNNLYEGCEKIYICSRIPTLSAHEDLKFNKLNMNDVRIKNDRTVSLFLRNGFQYYDLVEYGYDIDYESKGYAIMLYRNKI